MEDILKIIRMPKMAETKTARTKTAETKTAETGVSKGKKIKNRNVYIGTCPNCGTKVFMFPHKQKIE